VRPPNENPAYATAYSTVKLLDCLL